MPQLADYNLPQLKQLQARIAKEIERRESDTKASLLKRLRKLAEQAGIRLEDLLGCDPAATTATTKPAQLTAKPASTKREPLTAKYRNPNNLEQSWSGHGRRPGWFKAWVTNGGSITAQENAASVARKGLRSKPAVTAAAADSPPPHPLRDSSPPPAKRTTAYSESGTKPTFPEPNPAIRS